MICSDAIIVVNDAPNEIDSTSLMLRPLLFTPAVVWQICALQKAGVERFLLLCDAASLPAARNCAPACAQVAATDSPELMSAVRSFAAGVKGDVLAFLAPMWLSCEGAARLTADGGSSRSYAVGRLSGVQLAQCSDLAHLACYDTIDSLADASTLGISLADADDFHSVEYAARLDYNHYLMAHGVRMFNPLTAYIEPTVSIGAGTVVLPDVILRGATTIGNNCEIGPNTMIRDCVLGDGCIANASQLNEATFGNNVNIGPYAYVRPGTHVGDGCKVGDFVEVKNSTLGAGTKLPHLIYVGDSDVGAGCNFGCGTITCNYDGREKFRTTVGDNVFLGRNTNLVAPVRVGDGAYTAAGSTITRDVPEDALAVARTRQELREGWAAERRKK